MHTPGFQRGESSRCLLEKADNSYETENGHYAPERTRSVRFSIAEFCWFGLVFRTLSLDFRECLSFWLWRWCNTVMSRQGSQAWFVAKMQPSILLLFSMFIKRKCWRNISQVGFPLATYLFWPLWAFISQVLTLTSSGNCCIRKPSLAFSSAFFCLPMWGGPQKQTCEPSEQESQVRRTELMCREPLTID